MTRFNYSVRNNPSNRVTNSSGGLAFKQDKWTELAGLIFTSFAKDKYYEDFAKEQSRLHKLIIDCGPAYAAKCALVARNEYGLRSISHLVAAHVCKLQKLDESVCWQEFYERLIRRPDDMQEILALTDGKMSHAMRRAFRVKMEGYDEYQLAKYAKFQREQKVSLIDVMRLVHPHPTEALTKLKNMELVNTDTWESREGSVESWMELIISGKLGYLALLRNLNNMAKLGSMELNSLVEKALTNESHILKSKIFPFQFLKAYQSNVRYGNSISQACDIAMSNVPKFDGETVCLLDVSGSMGMYHVEHTAAMFAFSLQCPIYQFDTSAKKVYSDDRVALLHKVNQFRFDGGGTDFRCAFNFLRDNEVKADRLVILTDNQHWVGGDSSYGAFLEWQATVNEKEVDVWTIELASYGTAQFPQGKVRQLFGFSEKMFDVIPLLEKDPNGLREYIEKYDSLRES